MVFLYELLDSILGGLPGNDNTWNIRSYKSREQCHPLVHTPVSCKKIVLELKLLNENGGSEHLLLVSFAQM